jgi:hypothetical protein
MAEEFDVPLIAANGPTAFSLHLTACRCIFLTI